MAFKFNIARADDTTIDKAIESARSGGRYEGPTPPEGVYKTKIKKVWFRETKTGRPAINALFEIDETGDKAIYNGAGTFRLYLIPEDATDKNFSYFVSNIDALVMSLSNGTMDYKAFADVVRAGKVILKDPEAYDPSKNNEIIKFGNLRITGDQKATVKLEMGKPYNGVSRPEVVRLHDVPTKKSKNADLDAEGYETIAVTDSTDDFDEWLESNE